MGMTLAPVVGSGLVGGRAGLVTLVLVGEAAKVVLKMFLFARRPSRKEMAAGMRMGISSGSRGTSSAFASLRLSCNFTGLRDEIHALDG